MPHVMSHDARIYWRTDGDPALPALVLGNSLGTDFSLWDTVLPRLLRHFYVLRYDMRGHGASDAPPGDYTLERLTDDLEAVIEAAGLQRVHYAGISLGGMVGMHYAARRPAALERLVLCNTTTGFPDRDLWAARISAVLEDGMGAIAEAGIARFFTPDFVANNNVACQRVRNTLLSIDPKGYAGCCAAIRDMRLSEDDLARIQAPTLVVTGEFDVSTPPAMGQAIADRIAGSSHTTLRSAHIPCVEVPLAYTDALIAFLAPPANDSEASRLQAGIERRKQVLGNAHVERNLSTATSFNAPFQELLSRYAWGEIWTSTRFDDTQRRLLVLTMTAAQSRWEEFELHISACLRDGVELEAIQEALLQVTVYGGVPAGNTAFRLAAELIREHRDDD